MSFYKAYIRLAKPKKKLSVQYIDRTFLYYGGAESKVAVAIYDPRHPGALDLMPGL